MTRSTYYDFNTLTELRSMFWESHPQFAHLRKSRKTQNDYPADVRMAWVDWIEFLARDTQISQSLADRATL